MARSYPVRTVIQFSFEVAFSSFRANRKSRFTQPLAERIEIPFQSKKSCKSALLQSRSLFMRRPANRLKTGGRRRRLIAAEALAATQAHRSPWHEPRKIFASRIFSCVIPKGSMGYYSKDTKNVKKKGVPRRIICRAFGKTISAF